MNRSARAESGAPSFLIVSLRYLGDVLLSTPLALSIKRHRPDAEVDFLVFAGMEGILRKNPLIRNVYTIARGLDGARRFMELWRRYDVAIAANPSDRTTFFAAGAGRRSLGCSYLTGKEWWKSYLLDDVIPHRNDMHVVPTLLSLLEPLRIPAVPQVVVGFDGSDIAAVRSHLGSDPYVLFHPYARCTYKMWPARSWGALARLVRERLGFTVVFTSSPVPGDQAFTKELLDVLAPGIIIFPRVYALSEVAAAVDGSSGFVGVDTVVTHMSAALNKPTVALFGPTIADLWGPWPNGSQDPRPYQRKGRVQRQGASVVVQKDWPCVPCYREYCELSGGNEILCLEKLSPEEVFDELKISLAK